MALGAATLASQEAHDEPELIVWVLGVVWVISVLMVHPVLSIFSHELRYLLLVSVRTVLQQDFALLTNESARRDHLEALLR